MIKLKSPLEVRFSEHRVNCVAGSPYRVVYAGSFDEDGRLVVDEVGVVNRFEEIQTYAESVDINNIVHRYECGDNSALERAKGFFADVSSVPNSYVDTLNMIESAKEFFEHMPADFKQQFGNSYTEFIVQATEPDFFDKFTKKPVSAVPVVVDDEEGEEVEP